jgi:hypothetical protein
MLQLHTSSCSPLWARSNDLCIVLEKTSELRIVTCATHLCEVANIRLESCQGASSQWVLEAWVAGKIKRQQVGEARRYILLNYTLRVGF